MNCELLLSLSLSLSLSLLLTPSPMASTNVVSQSIDERHEHVITECVWYNCVADISFESQIDPIFALCDSSVCSALDSIIICCCSNLSFILSAYPSHCPATFSHRAIENTARAIPGVEVFASGRGLIQVHDAYKLLLEWHAREVERSCQVECAARLADYRIDVTLPRRDNARGVYLREMAETYGGVFRAAVALTPVFLDESAQLNRQRVRVMVIIVIVIISNNVAAMVSDESITTLMDRRRWSSSWPCA